MPFSELSRIDQYREYLYSTQSANANSQSPNDGSGNEQGSSNLRRAQTGDGGGPTSSPTIIGDGEGQKAAEAELGEFSFKTQGLLVLEGVDEDAEDADATFRDELIMLARDDPMWREELRKYLQDEEKERELIQKERAARLAHWREDMATQATWKLSRSQRSTRFYFRNLYTVRLNDTNRFLIIRIQFHIISPHPLYARISSVKLLETTSSFIQTLLPVLPIT